MTNKLKLHPIGLLITQDDICCRNKVIVNVYLGNTPYWTGSASRFVKEYISILSLTRSGTVWDFHHVSLVVFLEHFIRRIITLLLYSECLGGQHSIKYGYRHENSVTISGLGTNEKKKNNNNNNNNNTALIK